MEYWYYVLNGNDLDEPTVMGAINRAKRRFYLRPNYLIRHGGDLTRLLFTKWDVAWHIWSRVLFTGKTVDAVTRQSPANQRA